MASGGRKTSRGTGTKKKTSPKSSGTKSRKVSGSKSKKQPGKTAEEVNTYKDHVAFEAGITILVSLIISMFFYLSFFGFCGKAGVIAAGISFGFFGWLAWLLPIYLIVSYIFALANPGDKRVIRKVVSAGLFLLFFNTLKELLFRQEILPEYFTSNHVLQHEYMKCLYMSFEDVSKYGKGSGGMICRAIGELLASFLGLGGAAAVLAASLLLLAYIFHGPELMAAIRKRNAYQQEMEEAYDAYAQEEDYQEPVYRIRPLGKRTDRPSSSRGQGTVNAIDLKAAAKRLDEIEAGEQAKSEKNVKAKRSKKEQEEAAKAWEEGKPDNRRVEKRTEKRKIQETPADLQEIEADSTQIPIYREEMNQKFGEASGMTADKSGNGMKDTVPPVSAVKKQAQEPPSKIMPEEKNTAKEAAKQPVGEEKKEGISAEETEIFQSLQDKKQENEEIPYQFPPISLLSNPIRQSGQVSDMELRGIARNLQETLQSFHVEVEMGAVTCGPTVTRFEVLPAQGVRVNKITNLADDLKLSLAAPSIRIEAPIPGKSAVGIEVPNSSPSAVHFRELLEGKEFDRAKSPVTFAVGKDIAGKVIVTDIAKMPHLLIAGATGSGKSVCINTLIMSILYKSDPNEVKLIMIDPKVVELSCYNGIPHLFCPVVTDPKEAAAALNWAVREMMDRYNKFKELGVRNIAGYNEKIRSVDNAKEAGYDHMPLLVIIVDEFADLMMVASKEVEDAVCRLAQLARAAGIHLILATQRPSVNVITGVIKANIPSRIAFSVSSAIDSRTILDKGGAEKLLGKGDMLFFPSGYSEPVRLQGAFVSDKEVADVVAFLCNHNETPVYNESVTEIVEMPIQDGSGAAEDKKPDVDEYFEEAGRFVIDSGRAAAGQLQRRFSIGFNRAGRIIDQLNKAGVVGPAVGTKPRQVLMTMEEFDAYMNGGRGQAEPLPTEEAQEEMLVGEEQA